MAAMTRRRVRVATTLLRVTAFGLPLFVLPLGCGAHRPGRGTHDRLPPARRKVPMSQAAPHTLAADLPAALKQQIEPFLDPHATPAMLSARLGRKAESPGEGVLSFVPTDARFKEARLYLEEGASGPDAVSMLELTPADAAALHVADMDKAFGKSRPGIPPPEGNPFVIRYKYIPPAVPYEAELTVDLATSPDDPQARVTRIRITRFRRRS